MKYHADNAYEIAQVYPLRNQTDKAFEWMDRAYAQRDPSLMTTKVEPLLKSRFGTASYNPPDKDIPRLRRKDRTSLLRMIAGGVGAQMFAQIPMTGAGAEDDLRRFERIKSPKSKLTLEKVAKDIQTTFHDHEGTFRQVVDLIRARCMEFLKRTDLTTGRHILITEAELEPIFKGVSAK